jgi:hypothetical protein
MGDQGDEGKMSRAKLNQGQNILGQIVQGDDFYINQLKFFE